MSARRKDSKVLQLNGAFRKHPERARAREGEPPTDTLQPLGDPPAFLTEPERAAWHFIVGRAPPNVLKRRDEVLLAMAARWWAAMLSRPSEKVPASHVLRMTDLLARLGMTPSDCSRVMATPIRERNAFNEAVNGSR